MGAIKKVKSTVNKALNRSKEDLSASQQFIRSLTGSFSLEHGEFTKDIFGDERNTPHEEKRDAWRMMQNDIQVAQSVSKKALLILGRELTVDTDDEDTKEFFDQEVIPKLRKPLLVAARNAVLTGDGHVEIIRGEQSGVPVDFEEMLRPHKIYNMYADNSMDVVGYLQESFRENKGESFKVLVSERNTKRKKGSVFQADDIIHLTIGNSTMPGYGRSDFMSGLDDYRVSRELKYAQAKTARHKTIPRKAFLFNEQDQSSGIDEPGSTANSDTRRERENELNNLRWDENPVFHDIDLDIKDYSYDPNMTGYQEVLTKLSKDLTSPLPEFVNNHSGGNRVPSRQPMNLLQMELSSIRQGWKTEIDEVLQEIAKARGYDENVTVKFGDFSFPTRDEKTDEVMDLFSSNIITLGQAVNRLPFEVEVPPEYEDKYNFELDTGGNPFDQLGQKLDDMKNVDQKELNEVLGKGDEQS